MLVRPALFDSWLSALDLALLSFGATCGTLEHGNAKSPARLLCPPEQRHEFQGWDTAFVRRTVQVLTPDDNTSALGAPFGSLDQINERVREAVESSGELRQVILSLDRAPTEVVLARQCADFSKLTFHLRLNAMKVDPSLLANFRLPTSLCHQCVPHCGSAGPRQATTGVLFDGLSFRTAWPAALPAFIANRLISRPPRAHPF